MDQIARNSWRFCCAVVIVKPRFCQIQNFVITALPLSEAVSGFKWCRLDKASPVKGRMYPIFESSLLCGLLNRRIVIRIGCPVLLSSLLLRNTALRFMCIRENHFLFAHKRISPLDNFQARGLVEADVSFSARLNLCIAPVRL